MANPAPAPPDAQAVPLADDPSRIFGRPPATTFAAHLRRLGPLPGGDVIEEVRRAGLRGRGGARFPTARKLDAVAGRRTVVVANGCEGEPASSKDRTLLTFAPHLVLDGAQLAARAVGATVVHLCVERGQPELVSRIETALDERRAAGPDSVEVRLQQVPRRYLAGEESALVHWLNGGEAKPTFVPPRPFEQGVGRRPTLVDNVETLAHLALVARFGASWYRTLGTSDDPGTFLTTVTGAVSQPGVYEVPAGAPLPTVLGRAGGSIGAAQAVLVGGYFGTWLTIETAATLTMDHASLASAGASVGCGVLFALPRNACGLVELARVTRWLADQNAGQCGPCVHGLDAIARAVDRFAEGEDPTRTYHELAELVGLVAGRGACRHPDGATRFVASGLQVFYGHALEHHRSGPCAAHRPWLPTPRTGGWR
jgi:NADH:ubiquinone oxidoreductase subunit F (NADH-binding)